jgi:hypothetical protein
MNPRSVVALAVCCALIAASTACTYHRAHIDYEDYADKMPLSAEPFDGERLGTVAANEAGAIWNDCTKAARGTLWILMDDTKRLGGNAIGEIRWIPKKEKHITELPTCRKAWAWFLIWPATLSPVFMSSRAEAQAFRIPEGSKPTAGMYVIPDSNDDREALVERILAESPSLAMQD